MDNICVDHDIWWLEGHYQARNQRYDTPDVVAHVSSAMLSDIEQGSLVATHVEQIGNTSLLFVHGGISPEYLHTMDGGHSGSGGSFWSPAVSSMVQSQFLHSISTSCRQRSGTEQRCSHLGGYVFAAGKERGGGPIGGPLWTGAGPMKLCIILLIFY